MALKVFGLFQEANHFLGDKYTQVYECCLTNHNMGWPKYCQRALMTMHKRATEEQDTLAVLLYHDFKASAISLPSGSTVDLTVATDYPFDEKIKITVTSTAGLTLALRIPAWCHDATVLLANGTTASAQAGTLFHTMVVSGTSKLELELPMEIRLENRTAGAVAVHRGPLVYAYNVNWTANHSAEHPDGQCAGLGVAPVPRNGTFLCDIELEPKVQTSPAQIVISNETTFSFVRRSETMPTPPLGRGVFSSFLVPVEIRVTSPAGSNGKNFTMIPFGATDLRITELLPAAALPLLPPPLNYLATKLRVSGSAQLPFVPTAFNGSWPAGKMDGPAVTDNSAKDNGFVVLRSGSPQTSSTVLVYPKIQATRAYPLKSVSVGIRYETGYVGSNGPDVTVVAVSDTTKTKTILSRTNLTGYSFNACHEQRCYSPTLNGTASFDAALDGDVQLEIHFTNHDLNMQLLLPLEFELTWADHAALKTTDEDAGLGPADAASSLNGATTSAQASGFFWHISDVHVLYGRNVSWAPDKPPPGKPFGSHGSDATFESGLYQNLTSEMARRNAKPDFILLSGDISNEVKDIFEATRILKICFPTTPVYVSDGNHDVNLGFYNRANLTDPERLGPGTHTRDWTESSSPDTGDPDLGEDSQRLGLLESVWNATGWLSAPWCAGCLAPFCKAGVYSTPVFGVPGLRVLNVNTNPWIGPARHIYSWPPTNQRILASVNDLVER